MSKRPGKHVRDKEKEKTSRNRRTGPDYPPYQRMPFDNMYYRQNFIPNFHATPNFGYGPGPNFGHGPGPRIPRPEFLGPRQYAAPNLRYGPGPRISRPEFVRPNRPRLAIAVPPSSNEGNQPENNLSAAPSAAPSAPPSQPEISLSAKGSQVAVPIPQNPASSNEGNPLHAILKEKENCYENMPPIPIPFTTNHATPPSAPPSSNEGNLSAEISPSAEDNASRDGTSAKAVATPVAPQTPPVVNTQLSAAPTTALTESDQQKESCNFDGTADFTLSEATTSTPGRRQELQPEIILKLVPNPFSKMFANRRFGYREPNTDQNPASTSSGAAAQQVKPLPASTENVNDEAAIEPASTSSGATQEAGVIDFTAENAIGTPTNLPYLFKIDDKQFYCTAHKRHLNARGFKSHLKSAHVGDVYSDYLIKCTYEGCKESFSRLERMRLHMNTAHKTAAATLDLSKITIFIDI